MFKEAIVHFDTVTTAMVRRWPKSLRRFMIAITTLGQPAVVGTAAAVVGAIAWQNDHLNIVYALSIGLLAMAANSLVKHYVHRTRPDTLYVSNMFFKTSSFPSGHAFGATVTCGLLAYLAAVYLPAPWQVVTPICHVLFIFTVGVSRVYLGAHYPTDVIAGWLLGAIVAIAILMGVSLL